MSRWPVLRMLILSVCPLFPVALFAPAVAAEPPLLPRVVVDADGTGFIQSGTEVEFQASGFNYDHDLQGRLLEDYWHDEWSLVERDFHSMKQLGAAVVRVHLQFGRFMETPEQPRQAELEKLAQLLDLAEHEGLYLNLTGLGCYHKSDVPAWYDSLDENARWKAQQMFWRSVAGVGRHSTAVFCYDLMNEPVVGGDKPAGDWLGPAFAGKHFVQFIARETRGRSRVEIARQWVQTMKSAVREQDREALVTVGMVDWSLDRPGLTSGFVPREAGADLDFLSVHIYPDEKNRALATETLAGFQTGKPVVVEETFPLKCSATDLEAFMHGSQNRVQGWISFFWGTPETTANPSLSAAVTADWTDRFSGFLKASVRGSSTSKVPSEALQKIVAHVQQHPDGQAAYSLDLSAWDSETRDLPIGVFDSGIGGLTVLESLLTADNFNNKTLQPGADGASDFGNERFVYFGDQANMPYGNYPREDREDFLRGLVLRDAIFLLGRRSWDAADAEQPRLTKPPVKAIVIACNTATAFGLPAVQQAFKRWRIPVFVIGVVDSGARGVLERTSAGQRRSIAVLATVGTCSSNAYPRAIDNTLTLAGRPASEVFQRGSRGLAGAIEGDPVFVGPDRLPGVAAPDQLDPTLQDVYQFDPAGLLGDFQGQQQPKLNSVKNYIRFEVVSLLESLRTAKTPPRQPIDTIVLGCTHFPLVRAELELEFRRLRNLQRQGQFPYRSLIAEKLELIDPASLTAVDLFRELARRQLFVSNNEVAANATNRLMFFLSVPNVRFPGIRLTADGGLETAWKYGRSVQENLLQEDTRIVPLKTVLLPAASRALIRGRLPAVSAGIP